jgi:hypothetical protein
MEPGIQSVFDRIAYYNTDYNILICKQHQYAIKKINLKTHLLLHYNIPSTQRKQLVQFGLSLYQGEPIYPQEPISPISYLKIKEQSFKCLFPIEDRSCGTILGRIADIKTHCSRKHQWVNPRKRGRYSNISKEDSLPSYITQVPVQTFYTTGLGERFFEIILDLNQSSLEETPPQSSLFDLASQKLQVRQRQLDQLHPTGSSLGLLENQPNPWLERTGWVRHLDGFDRKTLRQWISPPDPTTQPEQILLVQTLRGLILRAQRNASPNLIGLASLEYINRKETGEKYSEKPLNWRLEQTTIQTYTSYWVSIVLYLYNTVNLSPPDRPSYTKKRDQTKKLRKLIEEIFDFLG